MNKLSYEYDLTSKTEVILSDDLICLFVV